MIYKVLSALGITIPAGKSNFDIICPSCGKKKLNINLIKGVFRCPRCGEGGGPIALYAFVKHGIPPTVFKNSDQYEQMKAELNDGVMRSGYDDSYKRPVIQERIDVDPADIAVRSETYKNFLEALSLNETHKANLIERGLPEDVIIKNEYKSVPMNNLVKVAASLVKDGNTLLGTPGFYVKSDAWTMQRNDTGFFVPVRDIQGRIQGLQIRFDNPFDGAKYRWFTSSDKEKGSKAKTWSHFVGYPEEEVYLTEGPLKADIINYFMDVPVIAVPGVNATTNLVPVLDELKSYGVRRICTAFDMDFLSNVHVAKAYDNLVTLLHEKGLEVKKMGWNEKFKGLDDFLLAQHKEEV